MTKKLLVIILTIICLLFSPNFLKIQAKSNVNQMVIVPKKITMTKGSKKKLKYYYKKVGIQKTFRANVRFRVSNNKIASVTQKGLITAKRKGRTVVTASIGGKKDSVLIIVKAPEENGTFSYNIKDDLNPSDGYDLYFTNSFSDDGVVAMTPHNIVSLEGDTAYFYLFPKKDKKNISNRIMIKLSNNNVQCLNKSVGQMKLKCKKSGITYMTIMDPQNPSYRLRIKIQVLKFNLAFMKSQIPKKIYRFMKKYDAKLIIQPKMKAVGKMYSNLVLKIKTYDRQSIYHECAHMMDWYNCGKYRFDPKKIASNSNKFRMIYLKEMNNNNWYNNDYANSSPAEYFAEGFVYYSLDKKNMKKALPKTYRYIDKIYKKFCSYKY